MSNGNDDEEGTIPDVKVTTERRVARVLKDIFGISGEKRRGLNILDCLNRVMYSFYTCSNARLSTFAKIQLKVSFNWFGTQGAPATNRRADIWHRVSKIPVYGMMCSILRALVTGVPAEEPKTKG